MEWKDSFGQVMMYLLIIPVAEEAGMNS